MATEYQVTCINKPHRQSAHEHITHIGNVSANWRVTRESAIQRINSGQAAFFTLDQHRRKVYVGVVRESGKQPYLRTHADGYWNDNLLAQEECGALCPIVS